ncbi:HAD family hydrolase [Clostridium sp. chh4-2]|uniref:D-glycero-alpha-D-manno-heptose-1,7-bisphosphate 7-phosphatase n=1 Tax=Clostridium sp. chh4-2 TaxID=2067550 RepID=UPI000CCDC6B3|nr:HAD family hydrolase [Clostridium sp. chh4-2]PNV59975.1 HAD family hydrolase [Clostridium sp. chh4-2]
MKPVIFLDRDGTINEEVNYLYRPEDLRILPGVPEAIRLFNEHGYQVVVVTNQAGVARGYYTEEDVENLHRYLNGRLESYGAHIDHFFYCPHHPEHGIGQYKKVCRCRKPATGLFERTEEFFPVDKENSYMIGDKLIDVEAGHNYGVKGILVGTGYGAQIYEELNKGKRADGEEKPYDFYSEDLMGAARYILKEK